MAKEIFLTQYGLMAERHWRQFRPAMVREMEAKGTLMEALFDAQERTIEEMEALTRQMETEQREGRIIRQGNQNEYVKIFRYVTEGSFDAYMWQTLETKCRFIAQVMTGDATVRRAEDVDSAALTYAEVKAIASGNPLVIEKATIDAEVMRLTRLKKQHTESLYQMRYRIRRLSDSGEILEREITNIREDLRTRISTRGDNFTMTVKNETFTDRVKAGRTLVFFAAAMKPFESTKAIGNIGGFPISVERFDERTTLLIHSKHNHRANVSDSPSGTTASLEHALDSFEDRLREREADLAQSRRQSVDLAKQLDQPFEHEEKLAAATERQQEIVTALDITKNQASVHVSDHSAQEDADEVQRLGSEAEHGHNVSARSQSQISRSDHKSCITT